MATPKKQRRRSSQKTSNEKTFIVRIAKGLSEYADVAVEAADASEAEEIVADLLSKESKLDDLNYEAGDDREGPYTCDSWESDGADQVALTIRHGVPIFPPAPAKLTCPYCNYDGKAYRIRRHFPLSGRRHHLARNHPLQER